VIFHRVRVKAPNLGKKRFLGKIVAPGLKEKAHHVKLPGRQADTVFPAHKRAGGKVEGGIAECQLVDLRTLTAQKCVDAGHELAHVKRLREIVVRAGVQALNAVFELRLCREHQNRRRAAAPAHLPREVKSIELRHHHVQNQKIVDPELGVFLAGLAVVRGFYRETLLLKGCFEGICQQHLVFYNQDFHRKTFLSAFVQRSFSILPRETERKLKFRQFTVCLQPGTRIFRLLSASGAMLTARNPRAKRRKENMP